ncbi:MAG TPA: peptidylprolyl isomerase [Candidatus Sumerlaeota bacterium]|nr:MAG: Foldase protein PrsA 3 precursor [candidate division BRC1 bacterium ADurb.Bin183]HOE63283.1 peptidylprolyl isomerase [Candidatus Sumerlaeota bacterium]HRR29871.1 peptidylprolyl isomerase [Candidatus Sumerlaeia bacterium]HON50641.1 peptidylprolyl isomerase [Candidatus Sumerlaeota bacterium]HOR65463.1 peptidylprolyl isomerase [Candidatus Sumerlaeota bacterium]
MKRLRFLMLIALVALCWTLAATGTLFAVPGAESKSDEKKAEETQSEEANPAVAKFDGSTLMMNDLINKANIRGGLRFRGADAEQIRNMPKTQIEEFVRDFLFNEKIAKIATEQKLEEDEKVKDAIKSIRHSSFSSIIYQKEVVEKCAKPAEEEIKKYYEDSKEKIFHQPLSFSMRHIFLSTYKPYTAQEGDTLESIAKKISGDEKAVEFILSDDDKKEPRWVKPEEREEKAFRPVQADEKLLVPMNKEETDAILSRMKKIQEEIKNGGDFTLIAKKYSESGANSGELLGPIIPSKDKKPMLSEILDAVNKLKAGEVSDIIRTKHGYNIIRIESKKEEGFVPFDEARRGIEARLNSERINKRAEESLFDFARQTPGIVLNDNIFTAENRTSDSVIISIEPEFKYTLGDYAADMPEAQRLMLKNNKDRTNAVLNSRKVIMPLLVKYGEFKKIHESDEFKTTFENRKIQVLADHMLRKMMEEVTKPTEDEMKAYYENNKERYTDPKQYDISLIGLKIMEQGEEMKEELKEKKIAELSENLKQVSAILKTKEDFENKAKEISEDPTAPQKGAVGFVPASYRNAYDGRLNQIKPGEITEPFEYGNFVYIVRLNDVKEETLRPFEESKRSVENDMFTEKQRNFLKDKKEEILKAGNFEFLLKDKEEEKK